MTRFYWRGTITQPFGSKFFRGIWAKHPGKFLHKTLLVKDNDVDSAFVMLNRLMRLEGLLRIIQNTRYYQKPCIQRRNLAELASNAIVEEDRERKLKFLMRKQRSDAYPGQITM